LQYSTTCIDNFFEDPMEIVKIAEDRTYAPDEMGRWPGVRSEPIQDWNHELFLYICHKWLLNHHTVDEMNDISWIGDMTFQVISSKYERGFIHNDYPMVHTAIVFLSPEAVGESGTSLYRLKDRYSIDDLPDKQEWHKKLASDRGLTEEEYKTYTEAVEINNSYFEETVRFKNVFNRAIGFDGELWHGADILKTNTLQDRLTLVIHFRDIVSKQTGLYRSRAYPFGNWKTGGWNYR
jgi:hypothetical protein